MPENGDAPTVGMDPAQRRPGHSGRLRPPENEAQLRAGPRGAPGARRRVLERTLWTLALVAAMGLATDAALVSTRNLSLVAGEVVNVGSSLTVQPGGVAVSALGVGAAGTTSGTAVELAVVAATASPGVTAGHYAYTATIHEASVAAVPAGTFGAELKVDGVSQGTVYFKQASSDILAIEIVTLTWDVGTVLPSSAVAYELTIA